MNFDDIDNLLAETRLMKKAFQAMPPQPAPAGAPPPGAGAPPPPPGAGAPPPQDAGAQGILPMLQQAGIDPNMVLQDPNAAAQIAQQLGMPPEQLMQMIQAEMGGAPQGGAPAPAPAEAAAPEAAPAQPSQMEQVVPQMMQAIEQMADVVSQVQQENAQLMQELRATQDEMIRMSEQVKMMQSAIQEPSPYEGAAAGGMM